jgi:hypothetical protein
MLFSSRSSPKEKGEQLGRGGAEKTCSNSRRAGTLRSGPSACPYSPNRSPSFSSTRPSSSTCSKAALASTLALMPAYQAGVSLVSASRKPSKVVKVPK